MLMLMSKKLTFRLIVTAAQALWIVMYTRVMGETVLDWIVLFLLASLFYANVMSDLRTIHNYSMTIKKEYEIIRELMEAKEGETDGI